MNPDYDLIVVGAGFAGLVAAQSAARRGLRVLVTERKAEPGATIHTTGILVAEAAAEHPVPEHLTRAISGVRLYTPGGRTIDLHSPGYAFYATDTAGLLRWLADETRAAGVELAFGSPFRAAQAGDGPIRLTDPAVSGRYLIGADGARSAVAEHFGLGRNHRILIGLEVEYEAVAGLDGGYLHTFLDSRVAPGYIAWLVPGVGVTQLGLACRRADKPNLARFEAKARSLFDFDAARVVGRRSGPIPCGGPVRPLGCPGVLLVGDAAGLVSPLTAGGIYTAFLYGRLAGEAVADHLLDGGPDPVRRLAAVYPRFFWKRLLRRALDLGPPNWLLDLGFSTAPARKFAQLVYFHSKGLESRAAWRDLIGGGSGEARDG